MRKPADNIVLAKCGIEVLIENLIVFRRKKLFPFTIFCILAKEKSIFAKVVTN